MKILSLITILFAFYSEAFSQWSYLGLGANDVGEIKIYGDTIYAGTNDGVYKKTLASSDTSWLRVGLEGMIVRTLLVLSNKEFFGVRNMYNTNDSALLYKTTDGGLTWRVVFKTQQPGFGDSKNSYFDAIDRPSGSRDTLYLLDPSIGIYKSINRGETWFKVYGDEGAWGARYLFVKVHPNNSSRIWMGGEVSTLNGTLWLSTDKGATWSSQQVSPGGDNACHTLRTISSDPRTWYIPGEGAVSKTTDEGVTWTRIFTNTLYNYDMEVSPANDNVLYLTGNNSNGPEATTYHIYRSTTAGLTWDTVIYDPQQPGNHGFYDIEVIRQNGIDVIIAGGNHGVYRFNNTVSNIDEDVETVLKGFIQSSPNPFSSRAKIFFSSQKLGDAKLQLTDAMGRIVCERATSIDRGMNTIDIDGSVLSEGIYFYSVIIGKEHFYGKMLRVR